MYFTINSVSYFEVHGFDFEEVQTTGRGPLRLLVKGITAGAGMSTIGMGPFRLLVNGILGASNPETKSPTVNGAGGTGIAIAAGFLVFLALFTILRAAALAVVARGLCLIKCNLIPRVFFCLVT